MIYILLFYEFFKIGLFAIGGGLVTVPVFFYLTTRFGWVTKPNFGGMIAVSASTSRPFGGDIAAYVGYTTAGFWGSIAATLGLVSPSVIIIVIIAKLLRKFGRAQSVQSVLSGVRPAVLALILCAGIAIGKMAVYNLTWAFIGPIFLGMNKYVEIPPIAFICLGAVFGNVLKI